ncbi:hypothetical protein K9853_10415 [Lacticaseibacillus paracasei]|uniref:hypothetical protein n=1 Tax=Lacticaseibacillus paracasei TaxID=1597 RepID=UPI001EDFF3C8|nr:hypothetical protein [Lacticaseibacillus paracasei]MCG4285110.1 hypothetical protein [Lacticaseibacillus paracasei]
MTNNDLKISVLSNKLFSLDTRVAELEKIILGSQKISNDIDDNHLTKNNTERYESKTKISKKEAITFLTQHSRDYFNNSNIEVKATAREEPGNVEFKINHQHKGYWNLKFARDRSNNTDVKWEGLFSYNGNPSDTKGTIFFVQNTERTLQDLIIIPLVDFKALLKKKNKDKNGFYWFYLQMQKNGKVVETRDQDSDLTKYLNAFQNLAR